MKTRIELDKMKEEARRICRQQFPGVSEEVVCDLLEIQAQHMRTDEVLRELQKRLAGGTNP